MYFSYDFKYLSERWFDEATPTNYDEGLAATIGSGTNGSVAITDTTKTELAIVAALAAAGGASASASYADGLISVVLGTNVGGTIDNAKNTATLIAAAINAIADKTWTATASGNGTTAITAFTEVAFDETVVYGTPCPIKGLGLYDADNNVYYVCTEADNTEYNTHWIKLTPSAV